MPDPPPAAVVGTAPPAAAPNVVYNIQNVTIQNVNVYNAPQAAPNNEVSDDEGDPEERAAMLAEMKRDSKRKRTSECGFTVSQLRKMSVAQRTAFSKKRGTLVGLCGHCAVNWRPLREAFLPDPEHENTMRKADLLVKAIEDYEKAFANGDKSAMREALDVVLAKRTSLCRPCADEVKKLSPKQLACKDEWEKMRREACAKHGGCPKRGCSEKEMASWICISADHVDPKTKVHDLSHYVWWACHGGVDAMRQEAQKCEWMCMCCHLLEPTSKTGRELSGTRPSYERVREKEAYVNARKLVIGTCQYDGCGRVVTKENVRSFSFDHTDPKTKATHETHPHLIQKAYVGGVSGIVHNSTTSLAYAKPFLDAEMGMCRLLCENCHKCRKPQKRGRWDAS